MASKGRTDRGGALGRITSSVSRPLRRIALVCSLVHRRGRTNVRRAECQLAASLPLSGSARRGSSGRDARQPGGLSQSTEEPAVRATCETWDASGAQDAKHPNATRTKLLKSD